MLQKEIKDGYLRVQLDYGRANTMNMEMVQQLIDTFEAAAEDDNIPGILLTGKPSFFSAGLNLIELYDYDKQQIMDFWMAFTKMSKTMASFPKPFVTAITGHSPAGGCVMAICSDYRVMAEGKYKIGLNEVAVAIPLPEYIFKLYSMWVGTGKAYHYLMEAKMLLPEEALLCGLVNEVCPFTEVEERAAKQLKKYLSFEQVGWRTSKQNLRKEILKSFDGNYEEDMDNRMKQWWQPETRAVMGGFVQMLKAKKG